MSCIISLRSATLMWNIPLMIGAHNMLHRDFLGVQRVYVLVHSIAVEFKWKLHSQHSWI